MADAPKLLAEWFWTDRWTGSSAFALPIEARGLYREMLTQAWRRGARLPNNHEAIRRIVGCTRSEWKRCWPKIESYWRVDGDELVNDTQLLVYGETVARKERDSKRGKKGATTRWTKRSSRKARAILKQCSSNAQALPEQCSGNSLLSPISSSSESTEHSLNGAVDVDVKPSSEAGHDAGSSPDVNIGAFIGEFCRLYASCRNGASYHVKREQHVPIVRNLLKTYGQARLVLLARILFKTDDEWISNTDRGLNVLSVKAAWLDNKLAEYEAKKGERVTV